MSPQPFTLKSLGLRASILTTSLLLCLSAGIAQAQVTTDGSVGAVVTQNGTAITIPQSLGLTNASGTTVLHSFSQFDINSTQTVTFQGSSSLTAIIARITSGASSSIDGTITSTAPNAALFLINPNGFVFGPNAVMNVPGSLYISTADKLNFADGTAIAMTATPVGTLSTASIASFGFLGAGTGNITMNGAPAGASPAWTVDGDLNIIASNLSLSETNMFVGNPDPSVRSQVRVGAVGTAIGSVGLTGPIGLSNGGTLSATDFSVYHTANGTNESVNDEYFSGGALTFSGDSLRFYTDEAHGRTDTISITADSIDMVNGIVDNFVQTTPSATAARPILNIAVSGALTMNNFDIFLSSWAAPGGTITIDAGSMSMSNNSLFTLSGSAYDGGTLNLTTSGNFSMDNSAINGNAVGNLPGYGFGTSYNPANPGNAGTINLTIGGQMSMTNGSEITVASNTPDGTVGGAAGTLTVHAGSLVMTDSDMTADAGGGGSSGAGNRPGGSLTVNVTGDATLTDINSNDSLPTLDSNSANGAGGTIALNVGGALTTKNTNFSAGGDQDAHTTPGAVSAGQITLTANSLTSTDDTITFSGNGTASGGSLSITTTNDANFTLPDIEGSSDNATGGTLVIKTGGKLSFAGATDTNPGVVLVDGNGSGASGSMTFTSSGNFTASDMYFSQSGYGTANLAGNFTVNSGADIDMSYTNIYSGSDGGVGGNVSLNGQNMTLTGSYLYVAGLQARSGDISVVGNTVLFDSTWLFGASFNGIGGNILIKANDLSLVGNSPAAYQMSTGAAYDPNFEILFNGVSYNSGARIISSGLNNSGNILIEAKTFTIGNNAAIIGGHPVFALDSTGEEVFSTWDASSANVTVHANTLVIDPGATIITAAGPSSQAGTLTLGATDLTMNGGTVETVGGTGGSIRIGADNSLTLQGGDIKTDITGTSAGAQDGDIDLGVTLTNPILINTACNSACASLFPFSTAWVPGTHAGFPATYSHTGTTVTALARGVVGRDVGQNIGVEPDNAFLPGRDPLQVNTTTITGGQALVVGPYFYPANNRTPASICSAADALQQGKSTMANLLMRIPDKASGGLGPETYGLPDATDGAALSLNSGCLDILDPRDDRLSHSDVSFSRPAHLVFDPVHPAS